MGIGLIKSANLWKMRKELLGIRNTRRKLRL